MAVWDIKNTKLLTEYGINSPLDKRMGVKMKAKVKESIKIEDGKHEGVIKELIERKEPYNYLDIFVEEKKQKIELRCGVPFYITENSALGQILANFGAKLEVNKEIEIEDFIKEGMEVEFITMTEKTERGSFARIISQSLKPKE